MPIPLRSEMPSRIAILAAAFDPRLNYQESVSARTLHRMGHRVHVFTTTAPIVREAADWPAVDAASGLTITRTERFIRLKNTTIPRDPEVAAQIRAFAPDWAFLFAPANGAGCTWMRHLPPSTKVVAFISDLPWHRTSRVLWWLVKRRWLRAVFRRADAVAAVTDDTAVMLRDTGGSLLDGKLLMTGLSYDAEIFGDAPGIVPPAVRELHGRCPRLVAIVTKAAPDKRLDETFSAVEKVLEAEPGTGFVLAGVGEDACGQALRRQVAASAVADRCVVLPVLNAVEVKGVFETAVCAVFTLVSIGIQQALACGCPVALRAGQPASHILQPGTNAERFADPADLADVLHRMLRRPWDRDAVRESIRPWRSETVLARVMDFASRPLAQRLAESRSLTSS